jgi:hypothetical protein
MGRKQSFITINLTKFLLSVVQDHKTHENYKKRIKGLTNAEYLPNGTSVLTNKAY